jgi:hypothetical protein
VITADQSGSLIFKVQSRCLGAVNLGNLHAKPMRDVENGCWISGATSARGEIGSEGEHSGFNF